jgi:hypothetical protein
MPDALCGRARVPVASAGWGRPTLDALYGPVRVWPISVRPKFQFRFKKNTKKGTSTASLAQYTPHPKSSKKNYDKQYLGLAKFSAATRVSDLFLP